MKKPKNLGNFDPQALDFKFNADALQIQQPLPPGDPFDGLPYTGDVETDTKLDLNEYQKENKEQLRKYEKLMEGIWDTEFWIAIAFKDRDDKEAFLKEFGFEDLGDKYIDGGKLARKLRKMRSGK